MNKVQATQVTENNKNVIFIENHIPALESGDYKMTLTQTTSGKSTDNQRDVSDTFSTEQAFTVQGQRFIIDPAKIYSCFPAANHQGDFSNCLPHIVLRSISLPWQRDLGSSYQSQHIPWLALLAFEQEEAPDLKTLTLDTFQTDQLPKNTTADQMLFYDFKQEVGEQDKDTCQVIDIPVALFNQLAPSTEELSYLAHIREVDTLNKTTPSQYHNVYAYQATQASSTAQFSLVMGSRLLTTPSQYTMHLVSLENMGKYLPDSDGNSNTPTDTTYVRLVSLYQWSFTVLPAKKQLSDIIKDLDKSPINLALPPLQDTTQAGATIFNAAVNMGYVPLTHSLRAGGTTASWYRGPLAPYEVNDNTVASWPQQSTDALVRYNPNTGLFDLSYAAAWQLGRLLGLQSKKFAQTLYQWKQQNIQATIHQLEQKILSDDLGVSELLMQGATQQTQQTPTELKQTARTAIKTLFQNYLQKTP